MRLVALQYSLGFTDMMTDGCHRTNASKATPMDTSGTLRIPSPVQQTLSHSLIDIHTIVYAEERDSQGLDI